MIFVTVGTQLPFDRLIEMVDEAAPELDQEIFAQTGSGKYIPKTLNIRNASHQRNLMKSFNCQNL